MLLDHLYSAVRKVLTKPRIEREAALLVDLSFCFTLLVLPGIYGAGLALGYFLFRDGLRLTKMRSFGKSVYHLQVVREDDGRAVGWRMGFLRNLLFLVPILNIADVFYFVKTGRRLIDKWLGLVVVSRP